MTRNHAPRPFKPRGTPSLMVRIVSDSRNRVAEPDWTREGHVYTSSNGWTVRRAWVASERDGWAVFAPDGCPEFYAADAVTAMERAEG